MSIHDFTTNLKKFPFYSENCKWLERKIQRIGTYTIHVAWNVLID